MPIDPVIKYNKNTIPRVRKELAAAMQELHDTHGVVFDLTSIYRDRDNKFHSDHSPHSSASAIDSHTFNNPSFLNFMFGNQYDQNTFSNTTSMKNWKMTPEEEAFYRKHNLRLFYERPAP